MGVAGIDLEHLFTFYFEDEHSRVWGDAWRGYYDGQRFLFSSKYYLFNLFFDRDLKLQEEEVESVHMMTIEEILQRSENGEDFTPDGIFAVRKYLEYASQS